MKINEQPKQYKPYFRHKGVKVELNEIENRLEECELVHQAAVLIEEQNEGNKRLVSYVIPNGSFNEEAIQTYLTSKLPDYMIPTMWVEIENFPLTSDGEIDNKALYELATIKTLKDKYVTPHNELERKLVNIWSEVLGIEKDKIGIHDNFFELGGTSLLAIRVLSAVEKITSNDLTLSYLFTYPTIKEFAGLILKNNEFSKIKSLAPIKSGNSKIPLYIVCYIGGALQPFYKFADMLDSNQAVYGLQFPYIDTLEESFYSIKNIAAGYVAEIVEQNPSGPYALSGYSQGGIIAFEMAKQLEAMGKKIVLLGMFDTLLFEETEGLKTSTNKNLHRIYSTIKKVILTSYFKVDDNLYLIRFNAKQAIQYKKNLLKKLLNKTAKVYPPTKEEIELQSFKKKIMELTKSAITQYKMTPYDKEIILFRARRRTLYMDDLKTLGWKSYAKSIKIYKIEGDHLSIFNPAHIGPFAKAMQECLNKCSVQ